MLKLPLVYRKQGPFKLKLISVLHAVILFAFFPLLANLLVSYQEITGFISLGNTKSTTDLTLRVENSSLTLLRGSSETIRSYSRNDMAGLEQTLKELKSQDSAFTKINLDPKVDITYEELVQIMDGLKDFQIHFSGLKT